MKKKSKTATTRLRKEPDKLGNDLRKACQTLIPGRKQASIFIGKYKKTSAPLCKWRQLN